MQEVVANMQSVIVWAGIHRMIEQMTIIPKQERTDGMRRHKLRI